MFSFDVDDKVEVKGVPDGYWDLSWWKATIIGYDSDVNKYIVEYETLEVPGSDGKPSGVKETDRKAEDQLRPLPPDDSKSKPITERALGDPVDIYYDEGWWEGWVKITRDEEIVICFDTGAEECTATLHEEEPPGEDPNRGNFLVRSRNQRWDTAAKKWRKSKRRALKADYRDERTRAAAPTPDTLPNAFTNVLPTSRQLDLAARMSSVPGQAHEQPEAAGNAEPHLGHATDSAREASPAALPASVSQSGQASGSAQEASAAAYIPLELSPGQASDSQQEPAAAVQPASVLTSGQPSESEHEASASARPASVPQPGQASAAEHETSAAAQSASVPEPGQASGSEREESTAAHPSTVQPSTVQPSGQASDPGQEGSAAAHPDSEAQSREALDPGAAQPATEPQPGQASDSEQEASAAARAAAPATRESQKSQDTTPAPQAARAPEFAALPAPTTQPQKAAEEREPSSKPPSPEAPAPSAAAAPAEELPAAESSVAAAASASQKSSKQSTEAARAPTAKGGQEQEREAAKPQKTMQTVRKATGRPPGQKPEQKKASPEVDRVKQVIKEKGLQKLPGRSMQDDVDEQEGALIWKIHEQVPEDIKSAVYKKLLPHRTLGEIRDWRNANLKKRKATEKPRQKPQQPLERLTSEGSGTFVRRPSLQQKHSATKSLQLVPSDDLFQDNLWGSSAEPQKPKAKPAAEAQGLAALPGKLTARKSFSAAPPQQSMPSAQQAAAKKLQQPEQQAQHSGSDALPNSIVREVSKAAAAFRKQGTQAISRETSVNESGAGTGSAAETAPPQSASLELQPFGTPLLRQHRDLRAEIPDWSLPTEQPYIKAEERNQETEPALRSQADLVQQPVTIAQPSHPPQGYTQQQGALSEVEILGQSAKRKRQPDAGKGLMSEGSQKAEALQQQSEGFCGHVPAPAEQTQASGVDTELAADPLFDHYKAMQQDSAAEALPASTLHSAASAKPEEATQPRSALGWTHQAASPLLLAAPRDPRKALAAARSLPGARLPSPPRPVKHPRDDSAADKHEGRPAIKRPKTEGLKPKRTIVVPSLPTPADTTPKIPGRKLPPIDLTNVNRSSVLCLDNLSCIWTSQNDLRQALKAVSPHIEGVRLAKEELMGGTHTCYWGWAALEFRHRQDAEQTLLKVQHLYVKTAASPIPRPLIVHFPYKTKEILVMEQELGHIKDLYLASHFAQPNSIEFQPAIAWRHQQKVIADLKAQQREEHAEQLQGIMREYLKEVGKETDCPTPDAKAAPPVETAWLFLKGLGREAIEKPETLRNVFTQWGAGDSATLIMDPATQTRRGTAIVQMQGTEQAHHLKQDFNMMVYIMHGTPRPLECHNIRLGAPKHCTQAVYDAALLDVFGRSDGNTHRLQLPELVCFEEAHTPEEIYAQRLRALLLHQAEERRKLQEMMLQERRRLHREHEALFDAEVRKLVELQHISRVPAVERLRMKPPRFVKDLPLRYKHLLQQGSQLLNSIAVNTETSAPEAADLLAKRTQEGTNGNRLQAGDKAGPRKLTGTTTNLNKPEQSKKPRNDSQMNRLENSHKAPVHDSNRRVHYERSVENGTPRQVEGMGDPRSSKGKSKGSDKHASNNRKVHAVSMSGSQGGLGPMRMGQVSPGRHKGRNAKGRGRQLGVSRMSMR